MIREVRITDDGSATFYVPDLNEPYHSMNGAVEESMVVFIGNGLKTITSKEIRIFEMGFGTGLNALLTLLYGNDRTIQYHALELNPIDWQEIKKLSYPNFLTLSEEHNNSFENMHKESWGKQISITANFELMKIKGSITELSINDKYDLVYFDAFAPEIQPELWEETIFVKLFDAMNSDGKLLTYCAKGEVRRRLQRAGFQVERLPGPPGKREMLRALRSCH